MCGFIVGHFKVDLKKFMIKIKFKKKKFQRFRSEDQVY